MNSLPALSSLERQALLIGLSDARHRRRISRPAMGNWLSALLQLMFGQTGVTPLANPKLEALRDLAMRSGGGVSHAGTETSASRLEPELLLSARQFLGESGTIRARTIQPCTNQCVMDEPNLRASARREVPERLGGMSTQPRYQELSIDIAS